MQNRTLCNGFCPRSGLMIVLISANAAGLRTILRSGFAAATSFLKGGFREAIKKAPLAKELSAQRTEDYLIPAMTALIRQSP